MWKRLVRCSMSQVLCLFICCAQLTFLNVVFVSIPSPSPFIRLQATWRVGEKSSFLVHFHERVNKLFSLVAWKTLLIAILYYHFVDKTSFLYVFQAYLWWIPIHKIILALRGNRQSTNFRMTNRSKNTPLKLLSCLLANGREIKNGVLLFRGVICISKKSSEE